MFLKNGATDFISKPFNKEELSCRINNNITAIENMDTVTNLARRDSLTGLYNRRYFFAVMKPYFTDNKDFVVAMIDIDNFKKINDTLGHDVGDEVIILLSDILRSSVSSYDLVSRFGGDEFCLVLKRISQSFCSF